MCVSCKCSTEKKFCAVKDSTKSALFKTVLLDYYYITQIYVRIISY